MNTLNKNFSSVITSETSKLIIETLLERKLSLSDIERMEKFIDKKIEEAIIVGGCESQGIKFRRANSNIRHWIEVTLSQHMGI